MQQLCCIFGIWPKKLAKKKWLKKIGRKKKWLKKIGRKKLAKKKLAEEKFGLKWGQIFKKLFYLSALELICCLPPTPTPTPPHPTPTLFLLSAPTFLLSAPTFMLSTPMTNGEATPEKATKCNKIPMFQRAKMREGGLPLPPVLQ
jgi:hypothetical protein